MADPRVVVTTGAGQEAADIQQRARLKHLSAFMQGEVTKKEGEKKNWCPFGCEQADLDDNGHCFHLIGFTQDQATYEPMVEEVRVREDPGTGEKSQYRTGRLVVKVPTRYDDTKRRDVPDLPRIPDGCHLIQITNTFRVYCKDPPKREVSKVPLQRRSPPNSLKDDAA